MKIWTSQQPWLKNFANIAGKAADLDEDQSSTHIGCVLHMDLKYDNAVHN